jgi:hypothetical protein
MPPVLAAAFWLATVGFGITVLLVAISAGKVTHAWEEALLLIIELDVEGAALLSLFGEIWFLAKTDIGVGMSASAALVIEIVVGLILVDPAVWFVGLIVANGYALIGRKLQFRPDFRGSLWLARSLATAGLLTLRRRAPIQVFISAPGRNRTCCLSVGS